ncbi:protocatechuate 3,4-dioxygenase [Sorangium sp. So ce381]|uniref:dioxygenase family protein n=1 Tax=Sorangium sp. So ce381 TaxID=3133307 RepID=UPI003F5BB372
MKQRKAPRALTRRDVLHGLGLALSAVPLAGLASCDDTSASAGSGGAGGAGGAGGTGGTASAGGWASGGTASMSGDYPDPFKDGVGATCAMTCALMLGPCYAETIERRDISEGYPGLPVRLALLVVDESCEPVEGASVDIWHTRNAGLYSGNDAVDMCTFDDADAESHRYFRGVQTTGADGRVDFNTCYPGWYQGRAVHIHFTLRVGGQEYVTSQLFFPEDLTAQLFAEHADYKEFGQPDTSNSADSIYAGDGALLSTALQPDGALLAWKVLVIRSSLEETLCGDADGPVPPGAGGGPPGFGGGPPGFGGGPPGFGDGPPDD